MSYYFKEGLEDETSKRVDAGIQCPECYGVQISEIIGFHRKFQCQECGCEWSGKAS